MKKLIGITLCIITLAINATFAHDLNYHHEFATIQLRKIKLLQFIHILEKLEFAL